MSRHVFVVRGDPRRLASDDVVPLRLRSTTEALATIEACRSVQSRRDDFERDRPLAVIPVEVRSTEEAVVLAAAIDALYTDRPRRRLEPDVALVAQDLPTFSALQALRRERERFADLDADHVKAARDLAERALASELAIFVGAGVSSAAGVPEWQALLECVARSAGIEGCELERLARLSLVDQAAVIEHRYGESHRDGRRELRRKLASFVKRDRASLAHHLLANLPARQFVTTNYDDLFERACEGIGVRISVLPHARTPDTDRWLLKLHGCVSRPEDIVFTREDYIRYEARHVALAGVMQALLFTQHVLFVGFSLNDDNFHKIADAVRSAPRQNDHGENATFGTALVLEDEPLRRELWEGDLRWVSMRGATSDGGAERDRAALARRLEIFLDCLLFHAWPTGPHVLDARFDVALNHAERTLARELDALATRVGSDVRADAGAPWKIVSRALTLLGAQTGSAQQRKPIE